ncbi:MAG: DUF1559 domain-containing protein, partial [Gemmataceae bacterium]
LGCQNNLKQIGLAMHSHESTYSFFPPAGWVANGNANTPYHSFHTYLLPFMEQENVQRGINLNAFSIAPANMTSSVLRTQIKSFLCPSAPQRQPSDYGPAFSMPAGVVLLGQTDYAVCDGIGGAFASALPSGTPSGETGFIRIDYSSSGTNRPRIADCTDGLSNTTVIWEDAGRPARYELGRLINSNGQLIGSGWYDMQTEFWVHDICNGTQAINCNNGDEIYAFHTGGTNVLWGDGHVSFVTQTTQPAVLAAIISRAGGEVLNVN